MLDVVSFSAGPSLHSCQVSKWHRCAAVTHRHGLRVQLALTVPVGGCEAGYLCRGVCGCASTFGKFAHLGD